MNQKKQFRADLRKWFLRMLAIGLLAGSGCGDSTFGTYRGLPAPLRDDFPYEFSGPAFSHYGGDSFQINNGGTLHYVVIEGVDAPKPGQAFYLEAKKQLAELINHKVLRIQTIRRDDYQREVGSVYVSVPDPNDATQTIELDVGYEMIRLGFGWYDRAEFEFADRYRAAEAAARDAKLGLWSQPDPIPPWEFEAGRKKNRSP